MKSWPVVFAMRAMSPERPRRTSMPSATSPARMRSRAGLRSSTDGICLLPDRSPHGAKRNAGSPDCGAARLHPGYKAGKLRTVALGLAGFRKRGDEVIEPMAGALELGGEVAAVVGVDRRVERQPPGHVDAGTGEAVELRRIVGEEAHARAAEDLEHARGDAVVALVVVEAERGVGVDRVETLVLELIGAHLVDKSDAAPFLLEIEDHAATGLV